MTSYNNNKFNNFRQVKIPWYSLLIVFGGLIGIVIIYSDLDETEKQQGILLSTTVISSAAFSKED